MNTYPSCNQKAIAFSLFELCKSKSTGTLYIETSQDHKALFTLKEGVITDLSFGLKRDLVAIAAIKSEVYKHIEFIEDYQEPMAEDTEVICSQTLLTHLGYDQHLVQSNAPKKVISYLAA